MGSEEKTAALEKQIQELRKKSEKRALIMSIGMLILSVSCLLFFLRFRRETDVILNSLKSVTDSINILYQFFQQ